MCGGRPGLCGDADWSPQRSALLSTLVASLADPSKIIVHVATKVPSVALETERWYGVEHGSRPLTREELEVLLAGAAPTKAVGESDRGGADDGDEEAEGSDGDEADETRAEGMEED